MIGIDCREAPPGARFALVAVVDPAQRRVVARSALRALLTASAGDDGELAETPRGPVGVGAWAGIGCSLAYADGAALVAIAPAASIGVDLVAIALPPEWRDLARAYCAPGALAAIALAAPADRARRFALAWARCEADAKCLGLPLREDPAPADHARLVRLTVDAPGFAAAAALRPLRCARAVDRIVAG